MIKYNCVPYSVKRYTFRHLCYYALGENILQLKFDKIKCMIIYYYIHFLNPNE